VLRLDITELRFALIDSASLTIIDKEKPRQNGDLRMAA